MADSFNFNVFERALLSPQQKESLSNLCSEQNVDPQQIRNIYDLSALCKFISLDDIIDRRIHRSVRKSPTYGQVLMLHLLQLASPEYKGLQSLHEFANSLPATLFLEDKTQNLPVRYRKSSSTDSILTKKEQTAKDKKSVKDKKLIPTIPSFASTPNSAIDYKIDESFIMKPELRYVIGRALEAVYSYGVVDLFDEIMINLFKKFLPLVKAICSAQNNLRLNSSLSQAIVAINQDEKNLMRYYTALPNWAQRLIHVDCITAALDYDEDDEPLIRSIKKARFYHELLQTPFLKELFRYNATEAQNLNLNDQLSGYGQNWSQKATHYNFNAQLRRISNDYTYKSNPNKKLKSVAKNPNLTLSDNLSKKDLQSAKNNKKAGGQKTNLEQLPEVDRLIQLRIEAQNKAHAKIRSLELLKKILSEQEFVVGDLRLFEPEYIEKSRQSKVYIISKTDTNALQLKYLCHNTIEDESKKGNLIGPNRRFSKTKDLKANTLWIEDFTYKDELARGLQIKCDSFSEKYKKEYLLQAQVEKEELTKRLMDLKHADLKQLQNIIRRLSLETKACVIRNLEYEPIYSMPRGRHPKNRPVEQVIKAYKLSNFEIKIDNKKLQKLLHQDNNYTIITNDLTSKFTDYELYCIERFHTSIESEWRMQKYQLDLQSLFLSNKCRIDTFLWFEHLSMFLNEFCKSLVNASQMNA